MPLWLFQLSFVATAQTARRIVLLGWAVARRLAWVWPAGLTCHGLWH